MVQQNIKNVHIGLVKHIGILEEKVDENDERIQNHIKWIEESLNEMEEKITKRFKDQLGLLEKNS